ncbi:MAG TPA: DUF1272 domain-containing protein [Thermoanaerobaculia bacterium]|nr:DUF1272 domain-containing protein [Thermoanaerobaculia bacterium]
MALEMRDRCERCDAELAHEQEAFICSYECTFCPSCTGGMEGRCPNCGGELVRRPRRAAMVA